MADSFNFVGFSWKITDFIMLVFTFFLALVAYWQWQWTTVGVSDNQISNRAFVFMKELKVTSYTDQNTNKVFWRFSPEWENSGNTPTRNLQINVNFDVRDSLLPSDFQFPHKGVGIPVVLGPHASILGDYIDVWGDDLTKVQQGIKHVYFWGTAKYNDVFKGTSEHISKFCYSIRIIAGDPNQNVNKDNSVNFRFAHHFQHNCHDDECKGQ